MSEEIWKLSHRYDLLKNFFLTILYFRIKFLKINVCFKFVCNTSTVIQKSTMESLQTILAIWYWKSCKLLRSRIKCIASFTFFFIYIFILLEWKIGGFGNYKPLWSYKWPNDAISSMNWRYFDSADICQ